MIRIAICDDEISQIEKIKKATEKYFSEKNVCFLCSTYANAFMFLEEIEKGGGFDIVLLDICMPGILGTEVAEEIRKRKEETEIIFLTRSDEFALEAFSLQATHYLLKPVNQEQFHEAMDRALLRYYKIHSSKVILKVVGGGVRVVNLDEIIYVESTAHVQSVYLRDHSCVKIRQSMSQLLDRFNHIASGQFVVPYKGYILNQKEIRMIKPDYIEMYDGKEIPLVKREYRKFQKDYFRFVFQGNE